MYIQASEHSGFFSSSQHCRFPSITDCRTSKEASVKANKAQHSALKLQVAHLTTHASHHMHRAFVYTTSLPGKVTTLKWKYFGATNHSKTLSSSLPPA